MTDLVGTCPKSFWEAWLAEGDLAGFPDTGTRYFWNSKHPLVSKINPSDRFYIVAHGKLRGWAPVIFVNSNYICRHGNAVACTIDEPITGFRGLRKRWWKREIEQEFLDWKIP